MNSMFYESKFNGELSKWDVSSAIDMRAVFYGSRFTGDISRWDTSSVVNESIMFLESDIAKKLGIENPSLDQVKSHFLGLRLEADLKDTSHRQSQVSKVRL